MPQRSHGSSGSDSKKWQDQLTETCQRQGIPPPVYQIVSDRRGGRTAWSCYATVGSTTYQARHWYDGSWVNNAREDVAEVVLRTRFGITRVP